MIEIKLYVKRGEQVPEIKTLGEYCNFLLKKIEAEVDSK